MNVDHLVAKDVDKIIYKEVKVPIEVKKEVLVKQEVEVPVEKVGPRPLPARAAFLVQG